MEKSLQDLYSEMLLERYKSHNRGYFPTEELSKPTISQAILTRLKQGPCSPYDLKMEVKGKVGKSYNEYLLKDSIAVNISLGLIEYDKHDKLYRLGKGSLNES